MRNSLSKVKQRIKWRNVSSVMIRNVILFGIGFPVFMMLLGLFLLLFPSFALGGSEFLTMNAVIHFIKDGLLMGFFWGLLINTLDIFLFTKASKESGNQP